MPAREDQRLLELLERAFAAHAGTDAVIDPAELQRALGLRSEYLARRIFAVFDQNGDGVIAKHEFMEGVRRLIFGTDREKLLFAFRVHDHDGDGSLDRQEVLRMIAISLSESDIAERRTQPAEQLTAALFAAADRDRDGRISFDELLALVQKRPELLSKMTRAEAIWIAPNEDLLAWLDRRAGGIDRSAEHGWAPRVVLALTVLANVLVFALAMLRADPGSAPMQLGRALGRCVSLDAALILVPMMRRLLTRVRASWLGRVVPVDEGIAFHKIVGHALFALSLAHGAAFVAAYAAGHSSSPLARVFLTSRGLTGAALALVFAVMWVFSLSFVRRGRRFELFYFTHLLYVAWFAVTVVHSPRFLLWGAVPLTVFGIEQIVRLWRRAPASPVTSIQPMRSGVTRLSVKRPPGFTFQAGDYVFLRLPQIARHEWHPFTISSAPERDDLAFHVRSLGNWTAALRRHAEQRPDDPSLVAYVDGPYGSPSARVFQARFAVLIGAGIGVTPFASVLESLVLRANARGAAPPLQRAAFFWLNRDQLSFEWFADLLQELERADHRQILEINLCMTGARSGVTSVGLELARKVLHAGGRSDIITGLRTHTHAGPPDWEAMLGAIARRHAPEPVEVFFCGPPGLGRKLKALCARLGMPFREEKF